MRPGIHAEAGQASFWSLAKIPAISFGAAFLIAATAVSISASVTAPIHHWKDAQNTPKTSRHAYVAQIQPAALETPTNQPIRAWYPDNNFVEWHLAVQPGQPLAGVSIRNSTSDTNRLLRFYLQTGNPEYPWMPAVDLFNQAGKPVEIKLPPGRYLVQTINSAIDRPYQTVQASQARNLAVVDLVQPDSSAIANLRLTIHDRNRVSSFRLDAKDGGMEPNPVARPIVNAAIRQAIRPTASQPKKSGHSTYEVASSEVDYAPLMRQALN